MRVSYPYFESIKALDTAKLHTLTQYNLANNLFTRLIEYNADHQLVAGAADSFKAQNAEVVFTFGKKITTIDGHLITADDAAFSLKRLIALGRSGHGDIRRLLCPNFTLKSVMDHCPGIRTDGNKLVLTPVQAHYVPLLISALESADYGIIPRSSLNEDGRTIIDFRNTSGPYFVSIDSADGRITLQANPGHFHYKPTMPQTVHMVPTAMGAGPALLESGQVDLVTTSEYYSGEAVARLLSESSNFSIFSSQPFRVDLVCFSKAAVKNFSVQERLRAAQTYAAAKTKLYPSPTGRPTFQFFQALSDGSLTAEQAVDVEEVRRTAETLHKPITLGVQFNYAEAYKKEFSAQTDIKVVGMERFPFEYEMKQRPDMYFGATDSAWNENLSLLGHNFEVGIFHLDGLSTDSWLDDYLATSSKEERIVKLNRLHFELLKNVVIYPFSASPYYAVASSEWSLNFSNLSSTTDLWRMQKK